MGNIVTGMGDEVSTTVSERTYRGNTRSRGKRRWDKESNGRSLPCTGSSSTTCTLAKHSTTTTSINILLAEKETLTV